MTTDKDQLNQQLQEKENLISEQKILIESSNKQLTEKVAALSVLQQTIEELKSQHQEVRDEMTEVREAKAQAEEEMEQYKSQSEALRNRVEELQMENKELMVQEKLVIEERFKELVCENSMLDYDSSC